jgi:hypothetical protein
MVNNKEYVYDGHLLARLINLSEIEQGLKFYSDNDDYIQIGTWNYSCGKILERHYHNHVPRDVTKTHEVIFVLYGSVKIDLYKEMKKVFSFEVGPLTLVQILDCGHGYKILEDETKVIEIKNGPYYGSDVDRTRF